MLPEEIKALIQKATENYNALMQENAKLASDITALTQKFNELKGSLS